MNDITDPNIVQSKYEELAKQYGFETTSITRSEEENRRVGGAANSQHLESRGTARDFRTKDKTPEQIAEFAEVLRGAGFHVITQDHGTGPHIHAQVGAGKRPSGKTAQYMATGDSTVDPKAPNMVEFERAWRGEYDEIDMASLRAKAMKQNLTDIEKGLGHQVAVDTLVAEAGHDGALETAVGVKNEFLKDAAQNTAAVAANSKPVLMPTNTNGSEIAVATAKQNAAIEREQFAQNLTWNDKWGANFGNSLLAGAVRAFDNDVADFYPNGWRYADKGLEEENALGLTLREREWRREAVSPDDVKRIDDLIQLQRYDQQIQGALSSSSQIGWSLVAGISDPIGWAAGLGVGKAAQMAKVGATTYAAAGRPIAALASGAIEGAVGNVISGAALEAMGDRRTLGDYVSDAGYGLLFGGALAGLPAARDARITSLNREMNAEAGIQNAELAIRAQAEAGPNATPDQVGRVMDRMMDEDDNAWRMAKLGNVDNKDRLFARTDVGAEPTGVATDMTAFSSETARQDLINRYGLENSIADADTRSVVAEVIARSEQIDGRIAIDRKKLKTFLAKADLEATSTKMLSSQSPVARAIGMMLMENPEGAAGRRSTAAISRSAHFEEYMGNVTRVADNSFEQWAREQGVGTFGQLFRDEPRIRFNRQVQLEMDRRWNGRPEVPVHPMVKRAADLYDTGYNMMARDQKFVGVLGADALDVNSRGYFQRSWNGAMLRGLTGSKRVAFLGAIEDQFRNVAKFSDGEGFDVRALAVQYLARLEHRAAGMLDVPANIYSQDAGSVIRDALNSMGLTKEQVDGQMRRFDRGRAGHTKERIDMDYSRVYDDGAGGQFQLVDFLDNDMNGLYRRYAQRTAGDVALTKYGVMGDNGAQVLKEAMLRTGATQKELDAFDQFIAEMTGKVFGKGDPLIVQNARMLTNLTRMGGAIFPQMGAYVDAVAGLGASRALKVAGLTNKFRKEVQDIAAGKQVNNPILGGFEGLGPEFGMADYRVFGIFDTTDMVDIAGKEAIGRGTKAIRAGAHLQRVLSGHRWVTAAQTRGVADQVVRKAMRYIKDGGEDVALRDMGINPEMAATLKARMDAIATFKDGELASFDPRKLNPDDIEGRRAVIEFRDSVMRGTNQMMNKEFPGEVGKWAHNGWLKMLFQFRTFSMVAQQKSFNRILHTQGSAKLTALLIGGMSVGVPVHMARVALRASLLSEDAREEFLEKQLHPMALGRAAMNYLAAMGLWADVVESASGLAAGWADVAGFEMPDALAPTGGRTMRDTSLIGGQFAPSLGVVNDIGQGVMGKPDKLWKTAPFASLPYVQPILMGIAEEFEE